MSKIIIVFIILLLSACTPVDKSKSSEQFAELCKDAVEIEITWHSSNGHFSLSCMLSSEKVKELNQ